MSGASARNDPEINLDEFERRLRAASAAPNGAEDPLAELARLVDMISQGGALGDPLAHPQGAQGLESAVAGGLARPIARSAPAGALQGVDFAAERYAAPSAPDGAAEGRKSRPRSWYFATAGLAAIGLALLAGAAVMKTGAPGQPKAPPFIAAAEGPSKVQPPSDATVQSSGDSAALLKKDSITAAPIKVVSHEEQPVDLAAQAPASAPSAAALPGASVVVASAAAGSPVAPAAETPIVAPVAATATVAPLFPEAKPVKTVSVRPDGTLISDAATPASSPAAAAAKPGTRAIDASPPAPAAAAEAATPKLDLPTKLSPKSSARVVAKTDTTAPAAATEPTPGAPLPLGSPAHAAKPAQAPSATAPVVADAVTPAAAAAPVEAAASEPTAAGGGWSVQLSAPRSEADAQSAISRFKNKYSAELGDTDLAVRKADVKGETIYRVRAGGLSKDAAAALCAKLKAGGGDCFIAKD